MLPKPLLPNTKWDGTSRERSDLSFNAAPDGDDWSRLLVEFLQLQDLALLRFTNAAASSLISNLTAETDFDVTGTLPANLLKAGDVIKIRVRGICPSTHSTDTLSIKLYIGSVLLGTISATNVANGDEFFLDAQVFVLSTAAIQAFVKQSTLAAPAAWTMSEKGVASSALDSTGAVVIKATATWSVADATNTVKVTELTVALQRGTN